jgi:hypothetical protein
MRAKLGNAIFSGLLIIMIYWNRQLYRSDFLLAGRSLDVKHVQYNPCVSE